MMLTYIHLFQYGEYEGCYQDSFNQRLFQGDMVKFKTDNSPEVCIQHCLETGYQFAGLQYGLVSSLYLVMGQFEAETLPQECFCGNTLPADKKKKISSDSCNMECPGDSAQSCGGYLTMDIFGTGITFPTLSELCPFHYQGLFLSSLQR